MRDKTGLTVTASLILTAAFVLAVLFALRHNPFH